MAPVDSVDRQLVKALRSNGRASYAELGRLVGLSGPSVQERVRRLEDRGVVTGYHADVNAHALGLGVTALIGILLSDSTSHDEITHLLEEVREIEDCWFIAGDDSFMVKVRSGDMDGLSEIIGRLQRIPGVARTRTTIVLSTTWEGRPIELDEPVQQ